MYKFDTIDEKEKDFILEHRESVVIMFQRYSIYNTSDFAVTLNITSQ